MKKFLVIYLGSKSALLNWKTMDDKEKKRRESLGMGAWMKWAKDNKRYIIDNGSPIGKTKLVNSDGISDTKNKIGAYTIVQAKSHEDAAKMFLNHPHFTIFPGESVEVMEFLPMPKM